MFTYVRLKREIFGIEEGRRKEYGMGEERERGKEGKTKEKKNERNVFLPGFANGLVNKLYPTNPDLHAGH